MTTTSELKPRLKRLRLGYRLNTLPERPALARRDQLDFLNRHEHLLFVGPAGVGEPCLAQALG